MEDDPDESETRKNKKLSDDEDEDEEEENEREDGSERVIHEQGNVLRGFYRGGGSDKFVITMVSFNLFSITGSVFQ